MNVKLIRVVLAIHVDRSFVKRWWSILLNKVARGSAWSADRHVVSIGDDDRIADGTAGCAPYGYCARDNTHQRYPRV